jgi:hypothetical protein
MAQKQNCQICGRVIYFEGICYECRQRKKREGYQSLSEQEIPGKIHKIIEALGDSFHNKEEYDDFFGLLAYRNISTEAIAQKALRAEVYYPCELYRDASPSVLKKLIEILSEPNCKHANHIIQCLAIAGGDDVLAAFI